MSLLSEPSQTALLGEEQDVIFHIITSLGEGLGLSF